MDIRPTSTSDSVTIAEIESRVKELKPDLADDAHRAVSLLFAILKQGSSIQKLEWFTRYGHKFLGRHVENLRSRGQLYTGTLSPTYVLSQVPGSEDLIERITGQRMVRKEKPQMVTVEENGHSPAPEICPSEGCGKAKGHRGRCRGVKFETKLSASERARKGAAARWAKAGNKVRQAPKSAARKTQKESRPAAAQTARVDFVIAYVDNEVEVKLRGDSMAKLQGAMEMIGKIQNGGSNG